MKRMFIVMLLIVSCGKETDIDCRKEGCPKATDVCVNSGILDWKGEIVYECK